MNTRPVSLYIQSLDVPSYATPASLPLPPFAPQRVHPSDHGVEVVFEAFPPSRCLQSLPSYSTSLMERLFVRHLPDLVVATRDIQQLESSAQIHLTFGIDLNGTSKRCAETERRRMCKESDGRATGRTSGVRGYKRFFLSGPGIIHLGSINSSRWTSRRYLVSVCHDLRT